jgi:hypothetical protein
VVPNLAPPNQELGLSLSLNVCVMHFFKFEVFVLRVHACTINAKQHGNLCGKTLHHTQKAGDLEFENTGKVRSIA